MVAVERYGARPRVTQPSCNIALDHHRRLARLQHSEGFLNAFTACNISTAVFSASRGRNGLKSAAMSQRELMLSGKPYEPWSKELQADRDRARDLIERYNVSLSKDKALRSGLIASLLGRIDKEHPPHLEAPFYCDYGYNIEVGKDFYCNFACALLDGNKITIGDRVLFGPNVHLYTPLHPLDPAERNGLEGPEMTEPITIGNDVWVAGGAIILPGVTIGDGSTVGAGSIVTKDVEPYTVVAGNPARVIRKLEKPNQPS